MYNGFMKTALIVGGTSGLGLCLAEKLAASKYDVIVTGRTDPKNPKLKFKKLDLSDYSKSADGIKRLVRGLPQIDLLVYAAGYFLDGTISELKEAQIDEMLSVGLRAPVLFLRLMTRHGLDGFVAVTSTSQWTPRPKEPIYTATKSGLGMLANSVSLDPKVKKVMVAGPAGMKTPFWRSTKTDTSEYLDPEWAADQVLNQWQGKFKYKFVQILRQPARVKVVEER